MDQAKAISKYIRISPRKARLAAALIRGMTVANASAQLLHCNMKAGRLLKKTLDTAVANAENTLDVRREDLVVTECRVDEGPRFKRAKPKNRGGQHAILKRTSHLIVAVGTV
jgi:large subunit ribosomal protein L22